MKNADGYTATGVFLCPWMGGMAQGARDGGVHISRMCGIAQRARDGGVHIPWMDDMVQRAMDSSIRIQQKYNIRQKIKKAVCLCLFVLINPGLAIAAPSTTDYAPFETRDQNLFNLIHGQALPTNAALLKKSQSSWSSNLNITNALNIESNSNESIYLDYESYRFNLSYQYGLSDDWNIKLDVPLMHQTGGIFDSAIDHWHQFWGLPRADRPVIKHDQYDIRYSIQDQGLVDLDETSTTLGDIQIAAARSLIETGSTTLSAWAAIKLPTGDENKLSGSGATDFSAWLALNQQLSDRWLINANTGVVALGDDNYKNIPLSEYALYGHLMLGWLVTENINLKVQLQAHTSYYEDSRLIILGDTYLLSFGGTIKINQCHQLEIAMSEDIKVDSSPDSSLIINWRYSPQNARSGHVHPSSAHPSSLHPAPC